jgi:hypothetical protein
MFHDFTTVLFMSQQRDLKEIERDLTGALIAFNMNRAVLSNKLATFNLREGAEDRLINYADELGVDHVLEVMRDQPFLLDLPRAATAAEIDDLKQALTAAYDNNHKVGLLNSEKQQVLREADPSLPKAVMVGGRPMVFDPEKNLAHWQDTGKSEPMSHEVVKTEQSQDEEQGRRARDVSAAYP